MLPWDKPAVDSCLPKVKTERQLRCLLVFFFQTLLNLCLTECLLMTESLASRVTISTTGWRRVPAAPPLHSSRVWSTAGLKCPPALTPPPQWDSRGLWTPMAACKHPSTPSRFTCSLTTLEDDPTDENTLQFPKINWQKIGYQTKPKKSEADSFCFPVFACVYSHAVMSDSSRPHGL